MCTRTEEGEQSADSGEEEQRLNTDGHEDGDNIGRENVGGQQLSRNHPPFAVYMDLFHDNVTITADISSNTNITTFTDV